MTPDFTHCPIELIRDIYVSADTLHRLLAKVIDESDDEDETVMEVVARIAAGAEEALLAAEKHVQHT